VGLWRTDNERVSFSGGSAAVVDPVLFDPEIGLRMVVNITAEALRLLYAPNQLGAPPSSGRAELVNRGGEGDRCHADRGHDR
jgi:hypothetical protein